MPEPEWRQPECILLAPQSYTFLISSDYERAEWRENIREQQKKCKWHLHERPGTSGLDIHLLLGFQAFSFFPRGWAAVLLSD